MVVSDARDENLTGLLLADRYQLGELLAQGALCAVYQAHDMVLARLVAVKAPPTSLTQTFRQGLEEAGAVSYPAFLAVYDVVEQDDRLYIVQEYVDGRPLSAYLADGAPARRAVALALQLARALAYAHQRELTHGDLTPAAILIDRSAVVHINNVRLPPDWEYFDALAVAASQSGFAASAETLSAALRADERVRDVWSAAAALWALVTRPAGDDAGGRVYREDATSELQTLIARALDLAHEPAADRLATADALTLALEALDDALTRETSAPHNTTPLAIRNYREEREGTSVGPRVGAGPQRVGRRHDDALYGLPNAPTIPGAGQYMWSDPNQTQPASDSPYSAPAPLVRATQRPARVGGAPNQHTNRRTGHPAQRPATAGPQPAWPSVQRDEAAQAVAASPLMRPWVWTLIGVVLFVAFFLIGFLVFPQVKLF